MSPVSMMMPFTTTSGCVAPKNDRGPRTVMLFVPPTADVVSTSTPARRPWIADAMSTDPARSVKAVLSSACTGMAARTRTVVALIPGWGSTDAGAAPVTGCGVGALLAGGLFGGLFDGLFGDVVTGRCSGLAGAA